MDVFTKLFGEFLVFVYHCFDRIVIHGYLTALPRPELVVHFFRDIVGVAEVSKEVLSQRTNDYQRWVEAYARNHSIPIECAEKGVRKEDHVLPWLNRMARRDAYGVYFIFKSMEQGPTYRISLPKYPSKDPHYRILADFLARPVVEGHRQGFGYAFAPRGGRGGDTDWREGDSHFGVDDNNCPATLRMGEDARLAEMKWSETPLEIAHGPSDGHDLNALSFAFAGVAESGTLALVSGRDNPTTLNFLPDNHVVVVKRDDIVADYEAVFVKLRAVYGKGGAPRTLNLITGPSRSADIEQTLLLGAHGPRRLHIVTLVGGRCIPANGADGKRA